MEINYDEIRKVDNSHLVQYVSQEHRKLINGRAGNEHYKLLVYLTKQIQNGLIVELGTHYGTSSLALSVNPSNQIRTYDVVDRFSTKIAVPNVTRCIGNIFEMDEAHFLLKADLIFLDTAHLGDFEWQVFQFLKNNNYRGIFLCDDIVWSDKMIEFWDKVDMPKFDITDIGHGKGDGPRGNISGTGVVDFSGQLVIKRSKEKRPFWLPEALQALFS